MRFSTSFIAAGLTAAVLAAPVFDQHKHAGGDVPEYDCDDEPSTRTSSAKDHSRTLSSKTTSSTILSNSSSILIASTPASSSAASTSMIVSFSTVPIPSSSVGTSSAEGLSTSSIPSSTLVVSTIVSKPSSSSSSEATSVPVTISSVQSTTSSIEPVTTSSASSIYVTSSASKPITTSIFSSTVKSSATTSSSSAVATATSSNNGTLQWFGVNESGAEFGTAIPGVLGTDYTWPETSSIKTLMDMGMNIFRIPFLMERLAQGTMTATLDTTYLAALTTVVEFITAAGGHAVIDPHNFGRYDGTVFTSTSDFQTFWTNVATEFKSNDNVIFDCNNEFHDEPSNTVVADLNQACIDGVRAAGATTQYVFVEGTSYTGAWTWTSSGNAAAMLSLTDPSDKIVYEMHQYLDSDGSGTSDVCVSSTIGAERIADATAWLQANGKKGIIGEFAGGANAVCESAVTGMLDAMETASDVWMGAMWWGGGPWWGTYMFSMEPSAGTAYVAYADMLEAYC